LFSFVVVVVVIIIYRFRIFYGSVRAIDNRNIIFDFFRDLREGVRRVTAAAAAAIPPPHANVYNVIATTENIYVRLTFGRGVCIRAAFSIDFAVSVRFVI